MRILLTGVTGQVGGTLARHLSGSELLLAARKVLDLSQTQAIASALDRLAPDLIINPAAYTGVDQAEDERDLVMKINAEIYYRFEL
jgi:dTDP-4-dehydrorhamnose reductase